MNYLSPSEYETYGLEATTPAVLAASTVIDAHCRRATLGVAQYDERLRIAAGRNTVRVTYVPLAVISSCHGRRLSQLWSLCHTQARRVAIRRHQLGYRAHVRLARHVDAVDPAGIDVYADNPAS